MSLTFFLAPDDRYWLLWIFDDSFCTYTPSQHKQIWQRLGRTLNGENDSDVLSVTLCIWFLLLSHLALCTYTFCEVPEVVDKLYYVEVHESVSMKKCTVWVCVQVTGAEVSSCHPKPSCIHAGALMLMDASQGSGAIIKPIRVPTTSIHLPPTTQPGIPTHHSLTTATTNTAAAAAAAAIPPPAPHPHPSAVRSLPLSPPACLHAPTSLATLLPTPPPPPTLHPSRFDSPHRWWNKTRERNRGKKNWKEKKFAAICKKAPRQMQVAQATARLHPSPDGNHCRVWGP